MAQRLFGPHRRLEGLTGPTGRGEGHEQTRLQVDRQSEYDRFDEADLRALLAARPDDPGARRHGR